MLVHLALGHGGDCVLVGGAWPEVGTEAQGHAVQPLPLRPALRYPAARLSARRVDPRDALLVVVPVLQLAQRAKHCRQGAVALAEDAAAAQRHLTARLVEGRQRSDVGR